MGASYDKCVDTEGCDWRACESSGMVPGGGSIVGAMAESWDEVGVEVDRDVVVIVGGGVLGGEGGVLEACVDAEVVG